MSDREIRATDGGLFSKGTYLGKIDDSGSVYDDENRYVGRFDENGNFYTPSGIFSERKQFRVTEDGAVYDDNGVFTYGNKLGSIDSDGTVRDPKGIAHATVKGGMPAFKQSESGGTGSTVGPIITDPPGGLSCAAIAAVLLAVAFAIGAFFLYPALLGSSSVEADSKASLIVTIAVSIVVAVLCIIAKGSNGSLRYSENLSLCFGVNWTVTALTFFVASWIIDGGYDFLTGALMVVGSLLITVVMSLLCSAIAAAVILSRAKL